MDVVLIEGGFMDNAEDTPRILTDPFVQKYARDIVNGIANYYGLKSNGTVPTVSNNSVSTNTSGITGDITYQSYDNVKKNGYQKL